jgi:hypothetical protein
LQEALVGKELRAFLGDPLRVAALARPQEEEESVEPLLLENCQAVGQELLPLLVRAIGEPFGEFRAPEIQVLHHALPLAWTS